MLVVDSRVNSSVTMPSRPWCSEARDANRTKNRAEAYHSWERAGTSVEISKGSYPSNVSVANCLRLIYMYNRRSPSPVSARPSTSAMAVIHWLCPTSLYST